MVNLAIQRLHARQLRLDGFCGLCTYNAAYMILDSRTSLLPISRCRISKSVIPVVTALLVPHLRITCTSAILIRSGMMLRAMTLSSRNNVSVLTYLPASRTMIIANANPVHHHETSRVGLSCTEVRAAGALE